MAHNVTHTIKGDKLVIEIDISKKSCEAAPPSSTGKTLTVATTSGSMPVMIPAAIGFAIGYSLNVSAKRNG